MSHNNFTQFFYYIFILTLSCSIVLPLYANPSPQENTTVDGRFRTKCEKSPNQVHGMKIKRICVLSFYNLISNTEYYNNKIISITGFLAIDNGRLVLFPNKLSYTGSVSVEGIMLNPPLKVSKNIISKARGGLYPVTVTGLFNGHYQGNTFYIPRLGSLNNITAVRYAPETHSDAPLDMHGIKILKKDR